jgi:hypothetical protein
MAKPDEEMAESEKLADSHYSQPHWARATTETPMKIGEKKDIVIVLIDHGLEINLISTEFYKQGRWPINTNHGWKIRAATINSINMYAAIDDYRRHAFKESAAVNTMYKTVNKKIKPVAIPLPKDSW